MKKYKPCTKCNQEIKGASYLTDIGWVCEKCEDEIIQEEYENNKQ